MRHSIHAWNKVSRRAICAIAFLLLPSCTKSAENSSAPSRRPNSSSSLTTAVISLSLLGHQRRSAEETRWEKEQEKAEPRVPSEHNTAYNKEGEAKQHSTIQRESMNNDFCWLSTSCEEFSLLTPPHDVISIVPPPPLPLFLFQKEIVLKSSESEDISFLIDRFSFKNYYIIEKNKKGEEEEFLVRVDPQWLSSDLLSECSLCGWAQNNSTASLFTQRESYKVARDVSWKWMNALLSVSFVSGIVGALFTCLLIKLKMHHRLKVVQILKDCDWPKEESDVDQISAATTITTNTSTTTTTTTTTNCVKISRTPEIVQDFFQTRVKEFSGISESKQGGIDSEETYINANSVCFSYADITPSNGSLTKDIKCNMCRKNVSFHHRHCGVADHDFHESRTRVFSPSENYSTPSSAYYSDLSVGKIHSSRKKKKKKRKTDLERNVNKLSNNTSRTRCALPLQKPVPSCTTGPTCGHALSMSCIRNVQSITHPLPWNKSGTNLSHGLEPCLHESSLYAKEKHVPTSTNVLCSMPKLPVSLQSSFECCKCTPVNVQQPGYVHLSPSYVHYVPNLTMLKGKNFINNYIGASYLESCETDNHLEITKLGNNLSEPSTHCDNNYFKHLFTSNEFQCRCVSCSETQINSFNSTRSMLHCGSHVACQLNSNAPLGSKCEARDGSLYELPSEYI